MKYESTFGSNVKVWHSSEPAKSIEMILGRPATHSTSIGERSRKGAQRVQTRTHCRFEIQNEKLADPEEMIDECLDLLAPAIPELRRIGADVCLTLKILDGEFIQINLMLETLTRLAEFGFDLCIENHSPKTAQ